MDVVERTAGVKQTSHHGYAQSKTGFILNGAPEPNTPLNGPDFQNHTDLLYHGLWLMLPSVTVKLCG